MIDVINRAKNELNTLRKDGNTGNYLSRLLQLRNYFPGEFDDYEVPAGSSLAELYQEIGQNGFGIVDVIRGTRYVVLKMVLDGWFVARSLEACTKNLVHLRPDVPLYKFMLADNNDPVVLP